MVLIIALTPENTTVEEDTGANLELTIYLDDVWEEIKEYERIYVYSRVVIPIKLEEGKRQEKIILRDNVSVAGIDATKEHITIIQKGYYEGECSNPEEIKVSCNIWRYDIRPLQEVVL